MQFISASPEDTMKIAGGLARDFKGAGGISGTYWWLWVVDAAVVNQDFLGGLCGSLCLVTFGALS